MSNYIDIRSTIKSGDMIALKRPTTWFAKSVSFITGSEYFHVGIALWINDRLLLAQMEPTGDNLVPLSQYTEFDVFECPKRTIGVEQFTWQILNNHIPYSFADLFKAAINILFHMKLPQTPGCLVCSEMVEFIYKQCGWVTEYDGIPTPASLAKKLTLKAQVTT